MVDWSPGRGSEQLGRRPAVVVQTNAGNLNPRYLNTIVVTVSTKGRPVPTHVPLQPSKENGLSRLSFAKCEQLLTISKRRLTRRLGKLNDSDMQGISHALRVVLNL